MRITLLQPSIGRRAGRRYLRLWQMEPLGLAQLAGLTPPGVELRLVDDRAEEVPFDEPTDLVAMTVETYTAKRAYQIASDYRRRGVPVVMGGFHPTLCTDEALAFADSVVAGEAEPVWAELVDDWRHGRPRPLYRAEAPARLDAARPDRSIFRGRRYLPIGLVEGSRGCRHRCEFCAVGACYGGTQRWRPADEVAEEMRRVARERRLIFLVDDNVGADATRARELFEALAPQPVPWIGQCGIQAARDETLAAAMARSGCRGVLIGFESLSPAGLRAMNKGFNLAGGDYATPLANLARHGLAVFGTFIFGYDGDTVESMRATLAFAVEQRLQLAAFAHLTPFPGTPLYRRLQQQRRLRFERWWLDDAYRFNEVAYEPIGMTPGELRYRCMEARRSFYSLASIATRAPRAMLRGSAFTALHYLSVNLLHRAEVGLRDGHPLGDPRWQGPLLPRHALLTGLPEARPAFASR